MHSPVTSCGQLNRLASSPLQSGLWRTVSLLLSSLCILVNERIALVKPRFVQTTLASGMSQEKPHTCPRVPFTQTSTIPCDESVPFTNRTVLSVIKRINKNKSRIHGLSPHHTGLVLTTFWKMLPNELKLCANGVERSSNCLRSVLELQGRARTSYMEGCSRTFSLFKFFPVLQLDGVRTYLKRGGRTTNGLLAVL